MPLQPIRQCASYLKLYRGLDKSSENLNPDMIANMCWLRVASNIIVSGYYQLNDSIYFGVVLDFLGEDYGHHKHIHV